MSLLIETIRLKDGQLNNLRYHEQRMQRAMTAVLGSDEKINLVAVLDEITAPQHGLFKCRVIYDNKINKIEFVPYAAPPLHLLQVVYDDEVLYPHKFKDRSILEQHVKNRGRCDDVLIVKRGLVTDASYANIVFKKGKEWITPSSCLLPGTQRQLLLDQELIREEEVSVGEIVGFSAFKLINSMLMFEGEEVSTGNIIR